MLPAMLRIPLLVPLILTVCAAGAVGEEAAGVTVRLFDGSELQGAPTYDAKGKVTIGGKTVALVDIDTLASTGTAVDAAVPAALRVWLADGSCLPASKVLAADGDDQVKVEGPLGTMLIPLSALIGWGGTDLPRVEHDQVTLAGGPLNGRVQGISGGKLRIANELDPNLAVPIEEVQAFALAAKPRPPRGAHLAVRLGPGQPPLFLVPGAPLHLAAAPDVGVALSAGVVGRMEGGRRVYLAAIKPASVQEDGAFGVVWPRSTDSNLDGTPLVLGGVRYDRGMVVHSQARLTWKLDGAYERLRAQVGIADLVGSEGDCVVDLLGDGKSLWRKEHVIGGEKPHALDVALTGVQVLELRVDYGERFDIGDHFALADAFLVKAAK